MPAAAAATIWNGKIVGYNARIGVTLRVDGSRVTGVTLTTVVTVAGRPGAYDLTATETVSADGRLTVSGFTLLPTG